MSGRSRPSRSQEEPASPLPAGSFTEWLVSFRAALDGGGGADVPCNGCTACCRSSQFIVIGPEEVETLARIPKPLRAPAPGAPEGTVVLGYDAQGHCPMLVDDRCSIYEHRPRTCRTYDCRVFAATGLSPALDRKPLVAARVDRWQFDGAGDDDRRHEQALRAAATYLRSHPDVLPGRRLPSTVIPLAVLAVSIHERFLDEAAPGAEEVRAAVQRAIGAPEEPSGGR